MAIATRPPLPLILSKRSPASALRIRDAELLFAIGMKRPPIRAAFPQLTTLYHNDGRRLSYWNILLRPADHHASAKDMLRILNLFESRRVEGVQVMPRIIDRMETLPHMGSAAGSQSRYGLATTQLSRWLEYHGTMAA